MIFDPSEVLGIPLEEKHQFQLFVALAIAMVWMNKNASQDGGIKLDI